MNGNNRCRDRCGGLEKADLAREQNDRDGTRVPLTGSGVKNVPERRDHCVMGNGGGIRVGDDGSRGTRLRLPTIYVDYREPARGLVASLQRGYLGAVEIVSLPAGDYVIGQEIAVERKSCADFALSVIDGRLFRQAARLKARYPACFFLIESGLDRAAVARDVTLHPNAYLGAVLSLILEWNISTLFVRDAAETVMLLDVLAHHLGRPGKEYYHRLGKQPKRPRKRQSYILEGFPGIGPALAETLLQRFGSLAAVFAASATELMSVPGIGKTYAFRLRNLLERSTT